MKSIERKELFHINKFSFYMLGLSVWETGPFYKHFKKLVLSVFCMYIVLQLGDLFVNVTDFDEFSSNAYIIFLYCFALYRYSMLYRNRKTFTELFDILEGGSFKTETAYGERLIERAQLRNRRMIYIFQFLSVSTSIFYALVPLLYWETKPYGFPQRIWIPFDVSKHYLYPVIYGLTFLITLTMNLLTVAQDLLIGSFLNFLCCHIEILSTSIQTLVEDIEEEANRLQISYTRSEAEDKFSSYLIDHIKQHNVLLKCADNLNNFYKSIMLTQFVLSTFMICSVAYQATQIFTTTTNIIQVICMIQWFACSITELLIFCGWGDELTTQSVNVARACYFLSWYKISSQSNRKLLQIVMIRAQRPVEMTVGGVYTLSYAAFMMLAKTSYSVFNLMLRSNK